MFESTLATTQDADLILKLYTLRTETEMRKARSWVIGQFFPQTAEEYSAWFATCPAEERSWFLQVWSYWEMAAAFVLHGALNADLFLDCNSEPFLLHAKFQHILPEIRQKTPGCMIKVGQLIEQYPEARVKVEQMAKIVPGLRAAAAARKELVGKG